MVSNFIQRVAYSLTHYFDLAGGVSFRSALASFQSPAFLSSPSFAASVYFHCLSRFSWFLLVETMFRTQMCSQHVLPAFGMFRLSGPLSGQNWRKKCMCAHVCVRVHVCYVCVCMCLCVCVYLLSQATL